MFYSEYKVTLIRSSQEHIVNAIELQFKAWGLVQRILRRRRGRRIVFPSTEVLIDTTDKKALLLELKIMKSRSFTPLLRSDPLPRMYPTTDIDLASIGAFCLAR